MNANEIKYEALKELGYTEEPDFNSDDDNAVNAINGGYSLTYKLALTSFNWSFAMKKDTLLKEDNEGKYKYVYTLPDDLLYIRGLYSDEQYQNTIDRYERNGDKIYTDSPELNIVYTSEVDEEELPPYFLEYFVYALARRNCTKITGDRDLLQEILHNEQVSYSVAKNTDIKQQAVRVLPTGVFTDVRF